MTDSNNLIGDGCLDDRINRIIEHIQQVDKKLDQPETEELNMEIEKDMREISKAVKQVISDDIESQAKKNNTTPKYTVYVDDNFHYMDENERYTEGEYDSKEEAIAVMKKIVDDCILSAFNQDRSTTADFLYAGYQMGGVDPWCMGTGFMAWDYAKELCEKLCAGNT